MPTLSSPQSQAGVMSFYDAQTKGPKLNVKIILVAIVIFATVIMVLDHFAYLH
jgi:preprotein translocase subunit Sec61beta